MSQGLLRLTRPFDPQAPCGQGACSPDTWPVAGAWICCIAAVPSTLSVPLVAALCFEHGPCPPSESSRSWVFSVHPLWTVLRGNRQARLCPGTRRGFQWRKPRRAAQEVGCTRTFFSPEFWDMRAWRTRPSCLGRQAPETLQSGRWHTRAHPPGPVLCLQELPRTSFTLRPEPVFPSTGAKQRCTRGERRTCS